MPPKMIGMGLLEAIPDEQLQAWAADNGGRVSTVMFNGEQQVGRFGWTAEATSVRHQVAKALFMDMGVGTAVEGFTPAELSDADLDDLTVYSMLLAVPAPKVALTELPGHIHFQTAGCESCHKMTVTTGEHTMPELSRQTIHPYTDLLLHDLGEGEFRTPPLWGLGSSGLVSFGDASQWSLMHDGLSTSLEAAIDRHQGDAQQSLEAFQLLPALQQQELLEYLRAL